MSQEPVDDSHLDAGIAARDSQKQESEAKETVKVETSQEVAQDTDTANEADDEGESEDTQNDSGEPATPGNETKKKTPRGVQKRLDELSKLRGDAERDRDYWRELAMKAQQPAKPEPAKPQNTGEPTLESCDFDQAEYQRQWYSWRRGEDKKLEAQEARSRSLVEKEAAFRAIHPDYDTVTRNPSLPITQAMAETIADSDTPAEVLYFLGTNPGEAAAIAAMTPTNMARAIGRIEAKLSAPPEQRQTVTPRNVSKAPAPVTTLSGSPSINKSLEDAATQEEYEAMRREQRAAMGKR